MTDKMLKEFISVMHSASIQSSVGHYRETTDDEVMLATTWYCNAKVGLSSPGIDVNPARAAIRKWLDIPLPFSHRNKGKGGGKGKPKGSRAHRHAPPAEFKDSPCSIPTNFYYDVYREMGAAEQYRREVLAVKGNKSALDDYIAHDYD